MSRRIVGIDLSLTSTGLCFIYGSAIDELSNLKSTGKKGDTLYQRSERLWVLGTNIMEEVTSFDPDLVVIEAPSFGSRFGSPHDRSGLWWAIVGGLRHDGFDVAEVAPTARAKYGTGKGNAKKDVVEAFVRERYQHLAPRRIANNDECDAILLAAMGARQLGEPIEIDEASEPNAPMLAAMDGVLWPKV